MRSLTSVTIDIWAVTAALALFLLVILLLEATDVLLKRTSPSLLGAHGLESGHVRKPAADLLVSIIHADWGIHAFHV
jgi:hypothetical protein